MRAAGLIVIGLLGACSKQEVRSSSSDAGAAGGPATTAAGATTPATKSVAPPGGPSVASPEGEKVALSENERAIRDSYRAALVAGRKATAAKNWDEAERAFTKALSFVADDSRALAERGYARLLAKKNVEAEKDLLAALGNGAGDKKLASQVWFNLGLVREAKKDGADQIAVAFAIANALAPSKAAAAKLQGKDTCTADVRLHGATPWKTLPSFEALDKAIAPDYQAPTAKERVCVQATTANVDDSTVEKGACDGPPPWVLHHHYDMFIMNAYAVIPKKPSGFLFDDLGMVGGWAARCQSFPEPTVALQGDVIVMHESFDGKDAAVDPVKESEDGLSLSCIDVMGHESDDYYDAKTGNHLATVFRVAGIPSPDVKLTGRTLRIQGAGCDRTIDL